MKKLTAAVLLALVLFSGCAKHTDRLENASGEAPVETAVPMETSPTVPSDGNPEDVTCKGSYSAGVEDVVVATAGDSQLRGGELQAWYWAEVAQYRQENHEMAPDFDMPLDAQVCQIDSSVGSWQQYFLREALDSWHTAQALLAHSKEVPMPTEEAYQPNLKNYEIYLVDIPATKFLYGYNTHYQLNTMHEAYLNTLPQTLTALAEEKGYSDAGEMAREAFGTAQEDMIRFADTYNQGYMYFTTRSYYMEPEAAETRGNGEQYVDIRQILLVPETVYQAPSQLWSPVETEPVVLSTVEVAADGKVSGDELAWTACEEKAQDILRQWGKINWGTEAGFADLAYKHSQDAGTAMDGGAYDRVRQGQLIGPVDAWCFDPDRQPGDTGMVRSEYGVHILYFCGSEEIAQAEAAEASYLRQQQAFLEEVREAYPMKVHYSDITLGTAQPAVSAGEVLYPDVAHERFPEVPVYLQQDYPTTMYGGFKITSNGCGITSLAMLATYMADEELTPPVLCQRYGRYSHSNGTDGMIFTYEPSAMGFYLRKITYDPREAKAALEEGQLVISVQHPGYWTSAGHYIVCESITEDGMVQVRDSNIYNYGKIKAHKEDLHKWSNITANGSGFWIFEDKVTTIPACERCGTGEEATQRSLQEEYLCEKCIPAMRRRNAYINGRMG